MPTHKIQFTEAEEFFYQHAGYSRAVDEPAYSGRARCAILLADAERTAERNGWDYEWMIDTDADTKPTDSYFVSGAAHWGCTLYDAEGKLLADLWSIDLGWATSEKLEPQHPSGDPYARVVQAELASEALRLLRQP